MSKNPKVQSSLSRHSLHTTHSSAVIKPRPKLRSLKQRRNPLFQEGWKAGKYYSNSGISNSFYKDEQQRSNDSLVLLGESSPSGPAKRYSSNTELRSYFQLNSNYPNKSMINYTKVDYDPITHVKKNRPTTTSLRMKGLAEILDNARLHQVKPNKGYTQALKANPREFYKRNGEFSAFSEICVKSRSKPFG